MKSLRPLSKIFLLIAAFFFTVADVSAGVKWDVAVLFLGKNAPSNSAEFQKDIDRNVMELARISNIKDINLSLYREMPQATYTYSPNGTQKIGLNSLLANDAGSISIQGQFKKAERKNLQNFLKNAFKSPQSKKILIIYGHGQGSEGLSELPLVEAKKLLNNIGTKLDILWWDSCFMGNTEFLHEVKTVADYTLASQEAEFTSGLPFETINMLPDLDNAKSAALFLAKSFIESYSYLLKGSQRANVSTSSATISIIDNNKWDEVIPLIRASKEIFEKLPDSVQKAILSELKKKYAMENRNLVDLGHLLLLIRKANKDSSDDKTLTSLIRLLSIDSQRKLKTNPRLKITPPVANALLVFGYNNWNNGSEKEYHDSIFSDLIVADQFVMGPKSQRWPAIVVEKEKLLILPFAPGVKSFDSYWADPKTFKPLSSPQTFVRASDVVMSATENRFVVFSAYTQAMGASAEKYTGLNSTTPKSAPSFEYFESDFNQAVGWLAL